MTAPNDRLAEWRVFDADWYRFTYKLVDRTLAAAPAKSPQDFYHACGPMLRHSPNPYFHERWYLARYPHVRDAVRNGACQSGFDHFLHHDHDNASPHWLFDPVFYRTRFRQARNHDLEATGDREIYDHFLTVGQHQGLTGHWLFDPAVYAALAPYDVACQIRRNGAFSTYLLHVQTSDTEPMVSLSFDPAWYLARYPRVAEEVAQGQWDCALHHYLAVADATQFDPSPRFSDRAYAAVHFDIAATVAAGGLRNAADHFFHHGQAEGRYFLPADTGAPDSGAPDSGAPDTGAPDTGAPDSGAPGRARPSVTAAFPLRTRVFADVTLLPCRPDPRSPTGSSFGVLGPDGAFLTAFDHKYHAMRTENATTVTEPGTYIYGGLLRAHFGHFLLDGIASLWFLRENPTLPVLWHWADPKVPCIPWPAWLTEIWHLLGLDRHRHHHIIAPITVERLILPDPGIPADNVLHPKQARALSIRPCTTPSPGNRVWLSRRGLPAELGRVEPEHEIEAVLASRGWTIIRPEDLPVAEQIDLFATAAVVAGCIGSAFHAVLLCAEPRAMLIMITRPWVPMEYFDAIAAARDLRQVYITPSLKPFDLINQQLVVEAVDPMALADAVCDAAGPS